MRHGLFALLCTGISLASGFHAGTRLVGVSSVCGPHASCSSARMLSLASYGSARSRCAANINRAFLGQRGSEFPLVATDGGQGGRGGVGVWGSGGGGGGGDGEEKVDGEMAALLKQYNIKASDLPPGTLILGLEKLRQFLDAYTAKGTGLNKWLINVWPAWRDKMLADPQFAYKLLVEETVGLGIAMSGTVAARGKDLLKELDFFLTDCAVGAVLNFVLIWLLAPSVTAKAAGSSVLANYVSKLPSFVLAEGSYTVQQRAMAGLYKGSLFAACGFLGSVGGTSIAAGLIQVRKLIDPKNNVDKPLPNIINNSLGWASFMFVSTNPRYQLVNGLERAMMTVASPAVGKASSLVLRTGNNLIGGATWVLWARFIGLQKKAEEPKPKPPKKKKFGLF